jgi:colanic acid biosynthesis glycosyl transferase WcaI
VRVTLISCVYPPEPVVSAQTSSQLAQALLEQGHEVTVIIPYPNRPGGRLYPGYKRRLFQLQKKDGISLVHCFSTLSTRPSVLSRLVENITFGLSSASALAVMEHPQVIYSNTWPLFATGLAMLVAKFRHIPVVISVQDLYPESLISQKRISEHHWVYRLLLRLDCWIARNSRVVIVISEHFANVYRSNRGVNPHQLKLIPNWCKPESVQVLPIQDTIRASEGIPADSFLFVYGGNISTSAGLETVIEAFNILTEAQPNCPHFLIAGDGSSLQACQQAVKKLNKPVVHFHTPWHIEETSEVLASADVLMLPTYGQQSLVSTPSKIITYMLASRPVLALASPESDLAHMIQQANCGWVVAPDQPERLAHLLIEIQQLPKQEIKQRGQAGRNYALESATDKVCLPALMDVLYEAAEGA